MNDCEKLIENPISKQGLKEDAIIAFSHIPRTGGDTLNRFLLQYYGKRRTLHFDNTRDVWNELRNFSMEDFQYLKCLIGHGVYYGVHEYIPKPVAYINMLREPVDRVISQYYLYLTDPENGMYEIIKEEDISLEQFQFDNPNVQTSQMTGFPFYCKTCPDLQDLEAIKKLIEDSYLFIGILDMYDESLFIIKKLLNWDRYVFWSKTRVNKKRIKKADVDPELQKAIAANNALDSDIYNTSKNKLKALIKALDPSEREELAFYRRACLFHNEIIKELSSFITKDFISAILQPKLEKILVLSMVSELTSVIEESLQIVNTTLQRPLDVKTLLSADVQNLFASFQDSNMLTYAKEADYIIVISQSGHDYFISDTLEHYEINKRKVVFALDSDEDRHFEGK